jgi:hypothetical protein
MKESCLPPNSKIVCNITIGDNIKCDVWNFETSPGDDNKIITQTDSPVLAPLSVV